MDPKQISTKTFKNYQKYLLKITQKKNTEKRKETEGTFPNFFYEVSL